VRLWPVGEEASEPLVLAGHEDAVWDVAFSPDGAWLASASMGNTVRLWPVGAAASEPLVLRGHELAVNAVAFSPNGSWLASASDDNTVRLWVAQTADLLALACRTAGRNFAQDEWAQYFGETPYRRTCDLLPLHPSLLAAAGELARGGEITASLGAISQALQLDPNVTIAAGVWNEICWNGSLYGAAGLALDACDAAVAADPEHGGIRNSRGLARALTGDVAGAIADFEFFVAWALETGEGRNIEWREAWIAELRAGRDPFDEETLARLRAE
jgi:hypothetical protein